MKNLLLICLTLSVFFTAQAKTEKAALFTDAEIATFIQQVKKKSKIPDHAIDIVFDFYKKNRVANGGLQDSSCVDKKEYKIRDKDPKVTKSYLKNGIENESCVCIIDYTVSKTEERGHCIFLTKNAEPEIENFLAAHGSGSAEKDGRPTKFTNSLSSTGTTLSGLFLTSKETYGFSGHMKGVGGYSSTGLSLYGMESSNWTAGNVGKATHGAPYVHAANSKGEKLNVGRSLGCPAMEVAQAKKMLPRCIGKAAWLNYTFDVKNRADLAPQSCK